MFNTFLTTRRRLLAGVLTGAMLPLALAGCGGGDTGAENGTSNGTTSTGNGSAMSSGGDGGGNSGGVKLNGAGATFPNPLYSRWFEDFGQKNGVTVNYQAVGSGAGITQLKNQTVDFAGSDVPLNAKAKAEMPGEVVQMPTCAGAVAIVYNVPGAPKNLKLSGDVIAGIYQGAIKNWNDAAIGKLNPGAKLPDRKIVVAHRSDGSGTTYIFTSYLSAVSAKWKSTVGASKSVNWPVGQGSKGNDGVAGIVSGQPGGIGYVELAYATDKEHPMSYASVRNSAGTFVTPDVASTTAAAEGGAAALAGDITKPIANSPAPKAYPIAGFTYILVYKKAKDAAKGEALNKLLQYAMTDGQKVAPELNYAPLPTSVVKLNQGLMAGLGK